RRETRDRQSQRPADAHRQAAVARGHQRSRRGQRISNREAAGRHRADGVGPRAERQRDLAGARSGGDPRHAVLRRRLESDQGGARRRTEDRRPDRAAESFRVSGGRKYSDADCDRRRLVRELATLYRYRQLIVALTARDLKARYRGSILGFFWSLANPLLLLGVYTLVFTIFFPQQVVHNYPLFLFAGILPWTFFSAAV